MPAVGLSHTSDSSAASPAIVLHPLFSHSRPSLGHPKRVGDIIEAVCAEGWQGRLISTCLGNNTWSPTAGTCYKSPTSCFGPPKTSPGPFTTGWPAYPTTAEFRDGDEIEANCQSSDYVGGYMAICNRGVWSAPYGNCSRDLSVCGTPTSNTGVYAQDWPTLDYDVTYSHGETVSVDCVPGGWWGAHQAGNIQAAVDMA